MQCKLYFGNSYQDMVVVKISSSKTHFIIADGDSGHERGGKKELLRSKKKDKKDKNKDKGYAALGEDSSPDEMDPSDGKWVM